MGHCPTDFIFFIMRHIIFILFLLFTILSKAQSRDILLTSISCQANKTFTMNLSKDTYQSNMYWKRHKALKITGYSALGVGGTMMTVGFLFNIIKNYDNNEGQHPQGYKIVGFVGVGITAASVPLLTFSYINKKKAKQISVNMESMKVSSPKGTMQTTPSLSFRIHF